MDDKERRAKNMRLKRAAARRAGIELPSDTWWKRNPEKHRQITARWRSNNLELSNALNREAQMRRRSTTWGAINNRIWPIMHSALRKPSRKERGGKYTDALGYSWADLRSHLEEQFTSEMTWENWGTVWQLDHIKPVSSFKYRGLRSPLFSQAWALSNLRPLLCADNQRKGKRG